MRSPLISGLVLALLVACSTGSPADGEPDAFVVDHLVVRQMPGVIPCAAPEGSNHGAPYRSGYYPGTPHETAAEALRAFVALEPPDGSGLRFADSGYIEMQFPESANVTGGYVVFGRDFGDGWVTLVGVYETDAGWAVTWWATSGC